MIASAELSEWLARLPRQMETRAAMQSVADRWSGRSLFVNLRRELDAVEDASAEAILAAAGRFMNRSDEIEELVLDMIRMAKADPFFRPPFPSVSSEISTGLLLWEDHRLSIALGTTGVDVLAAKKSGKRGATSIGFTGLRTAFKLIEAGGATLSFWEADQLHDGFDVASVGQCRFVGHRKPADGELFYLDGRCQSFVIEHAESDIVHMQALVRAEAAPVSVEYDSSTLRYVGAASTDEISSRTQTMVSLLRLMDRKEALPVIREALGSPYFYTRWHIMREFLAMDAEAAVPSLRQMAAEDPHPDVRAAAQTTLEAFFPEEVQEDSRCHA